ncbi:MAG: YbgC/FadM family acyl-CoA thioesterase [Campylobacterales bacterium]|nr:YbgC/FadM family acyl-CoA thioesterase [Campylobacterales bacterium]
MRIRVYYEDTDVGGVVYHSNYLKFCERARSELFFSRDMSPILEEGAFVVRSLKADFLKPAVFGDLLDVRTEFLDMKAASLTLRQTILRGEELLFEAQIRLAFVKDGKPVKIPQNTATIFTNA